METRAFVAARRVTLIVAASVCGCGGQVTSVDSAIVDSAQLDAPDSSAEVAEPDDSGIVVVADTATVADAIGFEIEAVPDTAYFETGCSASTPVFKCATTGAALVDQLSTALMACPGTCETTVTIEFDAIGCASGWDLSEAPGGAACIEAWLASHRAACMASQTLAPHWWCTR